MPAQKLKSCTAGMVESRLFPVLRLVATTAIRPVFSFVRVIDLVTCMAILREALVTVIGVAQPTGSLLMGSGQWKIRVPGVIEFNVGPACLLMTGNTILAETPTMKIILLMTGHTLTRCFMEIPFVIMTITAGQSCMSVFEHEISKIVIECFPVEPDDVVAPSLVLDVTGGTFRIPGRFKSAVKTRPGRLVLHDVQMIVAAKAQIPLQRFGKRRVTITAVLLDSGMRFGHRTGHDQGFDRN